MDPRHLTLLLRSSRDRLWKRMREVLAARGLDLETTAIAWSSEEGTNVEFAVFVTADRRVLQLLLVDGEVTEWNDLSGRWKRTPYAKEIRKAARLLVPGGRPVDAPVGTEIRLDMPHRGGHVSLWWTGAPGHRRASFWFEGRRLSISRSRVWIRDGRRSSDDAEHLQDMPAGALLDHLPPAPIHLHPKLTRTGIARLAEALDPAAHQTNQWVLSAAPSGGSPIARSGIHLEIDLDDMVVRYVEQDSFDG